MRGGAKEDCDGAGDTEGPAPGDCGESGARVDEDTLLGESGPVDDPFVDTVTLMGGRLPEGPIIDDVALIGAGTFCEGGRGELDGGPDAGRGIAGLEKSSSGWIYVGRGVLIGFWGRCFLFAFATSDRSASSSRRCCLSYMMVERTCSTSAAVTSSVTNRLCLSSER